MEVVATNVRRNEIEWSENQGEKQVKKNNQTEKERQKKLLDRIDES